MLGDVHFGTVKPFENSVFNIRNTHAANVPHLPVRSNNPLRYIAATSLLMHPIEGFNHQGSIIWMHDGQIPFEVRGTALWVKAVNSVKLVRPINTQIVSPTDAQIAGRPSPHLSEALPLAQIEPALL